MFYLHNSIHKRLRKMDLAKQSLITSQQIWPQKHWDSPQSPELGYVVLLGLTGEGQCILS